MLQILSDSMATSHQSKLTNTKEVSEVVEKIVHGPPGEAKNMQRVWLQAHAATTLCSDIPAMVWFLVAYLYLGGKCDGRGMEPGVWSQLCCYVSLGGCSLW